MGKNEIKPAIRFQGFTDAWEQRKLCDLLEFSNGFNGSSELYGEGVPYISVMDILNNDAITYECIRGKVRLDAKTLSRFAVNYGDVLFQRSSENVEDAGSSNVYVGEKTAAFGGFVIRGKKLFDYDVYFMKNLLDSAAVRNQITSKAQGAQHINVSQETLSGAVISIPPKEEQQLIGHLFCSINNTITLHQRKYHKLVSIKKSMLEKMFPRDGAKIPEIRFSGFTDPWEQRKLSDVSEKICVGFVGTCEKYYTDESGIPMYRTGNLKGLTLNHDDMKYVTREFHEKNKKSQLRKGDILIARHGDNGKAVNYELSEEANCLNIVIIRPDTKQCNYRFLADCINSPTISNHIKSLSAGSTQSVVNTSEIEQLDIVIPRTIDEQNRIAEFITGLDDLITLHQRKLEKLKNIKKAMLEKMFV